MQEQWVPNRLVPLWFSLYFVNPEPQSVQQMSQGWSQKLAVVIVSTWVSPMDSPGVGGPAGQARDGHAEKRTQMWEEEPITVRGARKLSIE